jgi:type VI secretion system protein VasJ
MAEEMKSGRELGTQPIRADAPSGDSVRYDPDFERLQAEMLKLDSVSNEPVAWPETVRLAHGILQGKSKDLLVASYLCRGSFEQRGYPGLAAGLACVDGMIAERWDSLYPEATRLRARINAVAWLAEGVGGADPRRPPRGDVRDSLSACDR